MSSPLKQKASNLPDAQQQQHTEDQPEQKAKKFDDVAFLQQCLEKARVLQPRELELFLADSLQKQDYRVNIRSSIIVDYYQFAIDFAKRHSYSAEKASALLLMLERLFQEIIDMKPTDSLDRISKLIKEKITENCVERSIRIVKKPPQPTPEELAEQEKKAKAAAKKGAKKEEELEEKPVEYETIVVPPLYSMDDAKEITQFLLFSVLQHWRLYNYAFNNDQPRDVHQYTVLLEETVTPLPLSSALEEVKYFQRLEDAKRQLQEQERKRQEEQDAARRKAEEEAMERKRKEEEEAKLPKLSRDDLQEIADYLKHHISQDIETKKKGLEGLLAELQEKATAATQTKGKK